MQTMTNVSTRNVFSAAKLCKKAEKLPWESDDMFPLTLDWADVVYTSVVPRGARAAV